MEPRDASMTDDLGDSLSTIRERHNKPLVALLLEIQKTRGEYTKSIEFIKTLECLYLFTPNNGFGSGVHLMESEGPCIPTAFKRCRINAFRKGEYVALSYTWENPLPSEQTWSKYFVRSPNGDFVESEVRGSVFDRVTKYMTHYNLHYLWIDRECIVQEASKEKEIALQAMDLVYNRSEHPIALLYKPVLSTADLRLLAELMKGRFSLQNACRTLELLEKIVDDVWWTRAWTYQENYRGGTNMKLLIPHQIPSEDYKSEYVELFEDVPGEIILDSTDFHAAATAFCLRFDPPQRLKQAKELVRERARKYTLLLQKPRLYGPDLAKRSMSPFIIADIEKRDLKLSSDRLPIIANCCQYSVRLDGIELAKRGYSVSLAILALFLLNGEILYNRPVDNARALGASNITSFLEMQAFRQYSPPQSVHGLTYNKSCRFTDVELTHHGIQTKGHLWRLDHYINTSDLPRNLPFVEDKGPLERNERRRLMLLANELWKRRYDCLYEEICRYLDNSDNSGYGNSFAKEYKNLMAKELAAAIRERKLLQLGALWSPSNEYRPYRAVFICNEPRPNSSPNYVFTASQEKQAHGDEDSLLNDIDRHVSLEVDCDDGMPPFLHTRRWIHGLCFFYRCPRRDVIFPWPDVITSI